MSLTVQQSNQNLNFKGLQKTRVKLKSPLINKETKPVNNKEINQAGLITSAVTWLLLISALIGGGLTAFIGSLSKNKDTQKIDIELNEGSHFSDYSGIKERIQNIQEDVKKANDNAADLGKKLRTMKKAGEFIGI